LAFFNKPTDLPVDQVKALRGRGFDNNQIIQTLQRNGYSSTQIFDALNQADLVSGNPAMNEGYGQQQNFAPQAQVQQAEPQPDPSLDIGSGDTEQMVESIIEEKWAAISKDLAKYQEWKQDFDTKIAKIEQRLDGMKDDYDKLHQAIIGKIGEYDRNILAVGAEIKAMEKVFSKVLPVFTDNVNELNKITQTLKKQ
jgi:hypothetical protein